MCFILILDAMQHHFKMVPYLQICNMFHSSNLHRLPMADVANNAFDSICRSSEVKAAGSFNSVTNGSSDPCWCCRCWNESPTPAAAPKSLLWKYLTEPSADDVITTSCCRGWTSKSVTAQRTSQIRSTDHTHQLTSAVMRLKIHTTRRCIAQIP